MADVPEMPDWVPIEQYGIGIPFMSLGFGLWMLYWAAPGIATFTTLSGYAKVGVVVISVVGIAATVIAGWAYASIDTGWWVFRKEDEQKDAEPVSFGDGDE